jgi:aminoglycoside/choline kinase family phosphotransferase
MDAPPPQEDVRPFVNIARRIAAAGLHAPEVLAADEAHGFLLLSDLGNRLYLDALREATPVEADRLMREAIAALVEWQARVDARGLPDYDEALLRRELALFPQWCVQTEFGQSWSDSQQAVWQQVCDRLVGSALAQPLVAVHRDWMPRNCQPQSGHPRLPRRRARTHHLRHRVHAARRVHLLGRGARTRLGRSLVARGSPHRCDGRPPLRRRLR